MVCLDARVFALDCIRVAASTGYNTVQILRCAKYKNPRFGWSVDIIEHNICVVCSVEINHHTSFKSIKLVDKFIL